LLTSQPIFCIQPYQYNIEISPQRRGGRKENIFRMDRVFDPIAAPAFCGIGSKETSSQRPLRLCGEHDFVPLSGEKSILDMNELIGSNP